VNRKETKTYSATNGCTNVLLR